MTVSFHNFDPKIQKEIAEKCGFSSAFELTQGAFKAKLSLTCDIKLPIHDQELNKITSMMSDISVSDEETSQPPKKKIMVKKAKSVSLDSTDDESLDDSFIDIEESEYDDKYPDGIFFKYGSQVLWLSFADGKINDLIDTDEYAAVIPHSYLKNKSGISTSLIIKRKDGTSPCISTISMSGKLRVEYLDEGMKMLVITIPSSLKNCDHFNFVMNILAKGFTQDVPKKLKDFFGRMDDNGDSGRWGMPNSEKMLHMLTKFGFELC